MNQRDIDMIRTELTPKCEVHISKDFKQRVLAKAKEGRKPRKVIKMWHWLSVSGIAACLPVILMLSPSRLTASSLLQNAISYLNNIRSMVMEVEIRTLPQENFKMIDAEEAFVNHQIEVVYGDELAWRVDKQGRIATGINDSAYTWVPAYQVGWETGKGKETFLDYISILLEPNKILERELELSQKNDGDEYMVKRVGDEIHLTVHAYLHYNYINDFMLNKSLKDAEHIRRYIFDKNTKQLKQLSVSIIVDGQEVEVMRTRHINYSVALGMNEVLAKPTDIEFSNADSSPSNRKSILSEMSAKEVAEKFLTSLGTWDTETLEEMMPANIAEMFGPVFKGCRLLSIGEPFQSGSMPCEYVPYVLKLRDDSTTVQNNLSLGKNEKGEWIFMGGL